ncbi:MAG: UbiD family decarboxylase [Dehalococcoidia bacterium]|nr:UbiD family decarboxylase [Dehalococcoidia bacterium]
MFKDLRTFLGYLVTHQDLVQVDEPLSPRHEIPAVLKQIDKSSGEAVLFSTSKGYGIPVVGNLLGRRRRLAAALGVKEERLAETYEARRSNPIKPVMRKRAPCQEVVYKQGINISRTIPVLTHHAKDVSPYFTCALTTFKDPDTGMRGVGLHRIQVKDRNTIGIFLATPPLSHIWARAEKKGQPLEFAIAIGLDPITFFSSVVRAPEGEDKFDIAGGLAGRPIELVKCKTVDVDVPAWAEFVLEGYLIPGRRDTEGPFGESDGYYFKYENPVGKIKAITHRRAPIYHALMPWTTEESVLMDLSWELDYLKNLQKSFPIVKHTAMRNLGMMTVVQVEKKADEEVPKLLSFLLESNPSIKVAVAVDTDVDLHDPREVEWAIATRCQPSRDVVMRDGLPGFSLDPSAGGGKYDDIQKAFVTTTSKIGIDATRPAHDPEGRFEKIDVPPRAKALAERLVKKLLV